MSTATLSYQSRSEELVNVITHAFGLLISIGGGAVIITFAGIYGTAWHIISVSVYSATLILLYTASSLHHSAQNLERKRRLLTFDQVCVYMLIAGTYTPFMLVTLRGGWGWSMFGVAWGLALVSTLILLLRTRQDILHVLSYLVLGWLIVIAIVPLIQNLSPWGLAWLFIGGISYTIGTVFYKWHRLPYNHGVWHICVLIGSACHFFGILFHVVLTG